MAGIKQIGRRTAKKPVKRKPTQRVSNQDKWLLKTIDKAIEHPQRPGGMGVFYPSMLGNLCDRYLYFAYHGLLLTQQISAQTQRIFDVGGALENRMEKYFTKAGIWLASEQSLRNEYPPVRGRYDFLLRHEEHERIILELKSINEKGFKLLKAEPKPEHTIQLQIYLNINEIGVELGIVLYENKNDQKLKAFKVAKSVEIWDNIKTRCIKIQNMKSNEVPRNCSGEFYCACREVTYDYGEQGDTMDSDESIREVNTISTDS